MMSQTIAPSKDNLSPTPSPQVDVIVDVNNALPPPSIVKPETRNESKKRKKMTAKECQHIKKKKASPSSSLNASVESTKQQSIAALMKKKTNFISVHKTSNPIIAHRDPFIKTLTIKNMVGQIGKSLRNNFSISCAKKTNRKSHRLISSSRLSPTDKKSELNDFSRCLLEDFMTLEKEAAAMILMPASFRNVAKWKIHFPPIADYECDLMFGKNKCILHHAQVHASPCFKEITSGMCSKKVDHGMGDGDFGCTFYFPLVQQHQLITWSEILVGQDVGMQEWEMKRNARDLTPLFINKRRCQTTLLNLLRNFYLELIGDTSSALELLLAYCKSVSKQKAEEAAMCENLVAELEPPLIDGKSHHKLLLCIGATFRDAMQKSCTAFSNLGGAAIDVDARNNMIEACKTTMPNHYKMVKRMMGVNGYENLSKNDLLKQSLFYDKKLFCAFLCSVRSKNPHNCSWWGIVSAAAAHGNGPSRLAQNKVVVALGSSCSAQTFLDKTRPFAMSMNSSVTKLLSSQDVIVSALDNNQKGRNCAFQRFRSSNKFAKVTARFLCEYVGDSSHINYISKPKIACVSQPIPSQLKMPPFEQVHGCEISVMENPFDYACDAYAPIDAESKRVSTDIRLTKT